MKRLTTLICLALLAIASNAHAEEWDAAGQLALLNRNKADLGSYDSWYSVAAIDGTVARYWTPHLKTEFDVGTAGEGRIYGPYREQKLRETTVGATALYQFFENQWVHPFIGGGVELAREHRRAEAFPPPTLRFPPATGLGIPSLAAVDEVKYSVRPVVSGGFKFYVSPHAFVRTDVRTALSADRPLALQWRAGIGFDF
jgi:hypothetical protein